MPEEVPEEVPVGEENAPERGGAGSTTSALDEIVAGKRAGLLDGTFSLDTGKRAGLSHCSVSKYHMSLYHPHFLPVSHHGLMPLHSITVSSQACACEHSGGATYSERVHQRLQGLRVWPGQALL